MKKKNRTAEAEYLNTMTDMQGAIGNNRLKK